MNLIAGNAAVAQNRGDVMRKRADLHEELGVVQGVRLDQGIWSQTEHMVKQNLSD